MSAVSIAPEELASLVARAVARERFPELGFTDPWAEAMVARLGVDARRFEDRPLRLAALHTMAVDALVRGFFARHPDGLAIALHPGLCTRFSRVDNGELRWVDIDPPGFAEMKCQLLGTPERHVVASCASIACTGWMDLLREARGIPTLLVAQGVHARASHDELDTFLLRAAARFLPGTELIVDYDARAPMRPSARRPLGACLELLRPDGSVARYPRLRFVPVGDDDASGVPSDVQSLNLVSRFFRGRGVPSVAHLAFA